MAKKSAGPNKSAAIREYYEANPGAKPKEVQEALSAQGIETSTAFISTIKSNMKKGTGTKKRGRPAGTSRRGRPAGRKAKATATRGTKRAAKAAPASVDGISMDGLIKAKKIVDELGSVEEARVALNALEKLLR
ncbi:hypothetical protein V7x_25540 [Crateriforma conspicua]|uniref:Uncharacterized protein n=1 Tax=Crateriforma conspicua TaxID=2527996 RepID=A0A5C6FV62_9PLAN|nr:MULTISPECIES: hypothetical protein [Crateriforma]TWU66982.1 hypothetical protein V7x_25540 [Crateriforma conspicua]